MESNIETKPAPPAWLTLFTVLLTASTVLLALYIGSPRPLQIDSLYQLFPLFGLLAFSIMWCHYVVAAIVRLSGQTYKMDAYFRYTGWIVLVFILLHPGLLIYQLWSDTGNLPPASYVGYVGEAGKMAVIFGSVALICFLLYESKRWLYKSAVWPYIVALSDIAMILIFIHGFRLGSSISGWYKYVWIFYGVTLVACIVQRISQSQAQSSLSKPIHQEINS